jgi:hypothetical protein
MRETAEMYALIGCSFVIVGEYGMAVFPADTVPMSKEDHL